MLLEEKTGYPTIDKPWLKYYSQEAIESAPFKGTVFQNIYLSNKLYKDEIALIYFGKKITYKELFCNIERSAKAFSAIGVKKNDIVAVCMPAMPETIYLILALNKIGASANLMNPLFSIENMKDGINEIRARVLVVANEVYGRVKDAIPNTKVETVVSCSALNSLGTIVKMVKQVKGIQGTVQWNKFIKNGEQSEYEEADYEPDMPAITVYSSGTTGASKGIQLTNDSINATICEGGQIGFEWKRQDRYLAPIPIWFSTGICASVLVPLRHGISVILEPQYDFEVFFQHIKKYKPNFIISAAGLYEYLIKNKYYCDAYKDFKYIVAGGEYITPFAEQRYNRWLEDNNASQKMHKGYGMCECGGTVTASSIHHNIVGSAGIPTPHVIVAAFDIETGEELPYGERGEIRVKTPCHMLGYYNKPEATAEYLQLGVDGDVWCHTGDMGYVTEDGSIYISGRLSDSYVDKNGKTIYLFDVERAVLGVSQIKACKTVVSEIDGKKTHVCHISIDSSADTTIVNEVISHCMDVLAKESVPKYFKLYRNGLPVASSGKLDVQKMQNDTDEIIAD